MSVDQNINSLILDIYRIMPSLGTYPFTMMAMLRTELSGLNIKPSLRSATQLIVLKRTDFNVSDLMDYVTNTKEYDTIPLDNREAFLDNYRRKSQDDAAMTEWCERIVSMGIGIIVHLAKTNGIYLKPVRADLTDLDAHFGFLSKNLQAYQLFDVNPFDQVSSGK